MVFDEDSQQYKPRYGYDSANKEGETQNFIMEQKGHYGQRHALSQHQHQHQHQRPALRRHRPTLPPPLMPRLPPPAPAAQP